MFFNIRSNLSLGLLCTTSVLAIATAAQAQGSGTETIVVTGSRVIADAANSPTPLTIVTTTQLQAVAPGDVETGLNDLPAFLGSTNNSSATNAGQNSGASALNLRNFGAQRTLVLLDGHRVAASNTDGTVDVEGLPQMLLQRVDVVTGGASAIYGSDAVTGVVNFVLDTHFTGMKVEGSAGISDYEDGATYNLGFAAGSDLFGGRGHWEGDFRVQHQDRVQDFRRPLANLNAAQTGSGTAASPLTITMYSTIANFAPGGYVTCSCDANGQQFITNNTLGRFNPGFGPGGQGGDGATGYNVHALVDLLQDEELFGRFSYNLDDDTTAYVQASGVLNYNKGNFVPWYVQSGTAANTYFANNAFLTPAAQALLSSHNASGKFQSFEFLNMHLGNDDSQITAPEENDASFTAGLDGTVFGKYAYSVYYTHGNARLKLNSPHNPSRQLMWAANDAVAGPGGTIQCYVSTTSYAHLYPGCVPIDPFGPNTLTASQYNYVTGDTYFIEKNQIDDAGGSISGSMFDDWAGPVNAALSVEGRGNSLGIVSNSEVNGSPLVNCTGLRLCNTQSLIWQGSVTNPMPTKFMSVWEVAGEVNVPLIKDVPLVQSLSVDFAGRFTDYSTTGNVETWKIGVDYHVNDEIRFRATNSVDIRAPTLFDLYAPTSSTNGGGTDLHTNVTAVLPTNSQGNPCLVPEIARTYTGGVVFTPDFVPGLTLSVDYYRINMSNVISQVSGGTLSVEAACETSNGASPLCALNVRPLPFSDHTLANLPFYRITENLNSAFQDTEGWDIELNYGFQMGDLWTDAPGAVNLRMLANIVPVLESQSYSGAPINLSSVINATSSAKGNVSSFLTYTVGSWSFNLLDRWLSGFPNASYIGQVLSPVFSHVNSVNYQNVTVDKKFTIDDQTVDGYLSIQNAGNVQPPMNLVTSNAGVAGDYDQGINGNRTSIYNLIGRFYTIGLRARF